MDINLLRICVTVASFLVFLGVMAYAVHPANRRRFERAAQLPFDEEGTLIPAVAMNAQGGRTLTPTLSLKVEGASVGQGLAREGIAR
jgi:cytochrome c oxidase cbb3-type subunit 4